MTVASFPAPKLRASLCRLKFILRWLLATFLAAGGPCPAAESSAASARLTVAVLTFEDQTGDPEAAHWRYLVERLLAEGLAEAKALRKVPAAFGYRQLKLKRGDPISADQARKIGELIETRRVVWGTYRREGDKWHVTAQVLTVADGKVFAVASFLPPTGSNGNFMGPARPPHRPSTPWRASSRAPRARSAALQWWSRSRRWRRTGSDIPCLPHC